MATILMTWELGGGLGHLARLALIADALHGRGHTVVAVLQDLCRAHTFFASGSATLLQAPIRRRPPANAFRRTVTFAHILHNMGFADADELTTMVQAWRRIFRCERPDLILFDHSPTAMLAARGLVGRRAAIGTGFCCPPDVTPLPILRPAERIDPARLVADERRVLAVANDALARIGEPALERLTELYADVDDTFLTTFRELDHYPSRPPARYWGPAGRGGGMIPQWPDADGKRVFVYLKPFENLPDLLDILLRLRLPTVVHVEQAPAAVVQRFTGPAMRFEAQPVDMGIAARECDVAVLNGTHASTITMLLAGKPALHLPTYLEQGLCAAAVKRLGAGLSAPHNQPHRIEGEFRALVASDEFTAAAAAFARRYASFDTRAHWCQLVDRLESLAGGAPDRAAR